MLIHRQVSRPSLSSPLTVSHFGTQSTSSLRARKRRFALVFWDAEVDGWLSGHPETPRKRRLSTLGHDASLPVAGQNLFCLVLHKPCEGSFARSQELQQGGS